MTIEENLQGVSMFGLVVMMCDNDELYEAANNAWLRGMRGG